MTRDSCFLLCLPGAQSRKPWVQGESCRCLRSEDSQVFCQLPEMVYKWQELAHLSLTLDTGPPLGQGVSAGACVS